MEPIQVYQERFLGLLHNFARNEAIDITRNWLQSGELTVPQLYEQVLAPALNRIVVDHNNRDEAIWQEHIMSGIVRAVVENAQPFVLQEHRRNAGAASLKVLILCPQEEYHEIGPRMGADFFTMQGDEVFFVGCNTPKGSMVSACHSLQPDVLVISVTNFLNLASLQPTIAKIKEESGGRVRVVLSGSALFRTHKSPGEFGADAVLLSYEEITAWRRDDHGIRV